MTVLDPDHPSVHLAACDAVVHGPVFATKRAPHSPLKGLDAAADGTAPDATWRIGHGPRRDRHPGQDRRRRGRHHDRRDRGDQPRLPRARPLAFRAGGQGQAALPRPTRARRRRSPSTRTGPARSSSSSSTIGTATKAVAVEERQVGKTRFEQDGARRRDARQPAGPHRTLLTHPGRPGPCPRRPPDRGPAGRARPAPRGDRDRPEPVISQGARSRRLGARPDRRAHSRHRTRSPGRSSATSRPGSSELEADGADGGGRRAARRAPARPAAARRPRGLPVRVRKLSARDFRRYRAFDIDFAPGLTVLRGPNEAGKTHDPARARARPHPSGDEHGRRDRGASVHGTRSADARSIDRDRVRAGRGGRPEDRDAREDLRRRQGHGPPRLRRPVDLGSDPRRPGHGRADRHPDRGVLPLDRVGPPFRAERPVAR